MADQPFAGHPHHYQPSKLAQAAKAITSACIGLSLVGFSGLTSVAAVILLVTATPILVLCSPVLVPAAIVTSLAVGGFVVGGGSGIAAVTTLFWCYRYVRGKHPTGADKLDKTMEGITNKAMQMKNRAKMYGSHGQYFFY